MLYKPHDWSAPVRPVARTPIGVALPAGALVLVMASVLAAAVPIRDAGPQFALVAVTVAGVAGATRHWGASMYLAGAEFLIVDGFLVNRTGDLSWHGAADLLRLLTLGAAVILGGLTRTVFDHQESSARSRRTVGVAGNVGGDGA